MSSSAASEGMDISGLSIEQLSRLQSQTQEDIKALSSNLEQLKMAQSRFIDSAAALNALPTDSEGRDMLVPLTSSLYVPGRMSSLSEVLLDVGTGYFVGKTASEAAAVLTKKSKRVKEDTDGLARVIATKTSNAEVIQGVLESKIAAARAAGVAGQ